MNHLRAFVAAITVPSVILPILLCIALAAGKPDILTVPFLHFIPVIWGIWNIIYFSYLRDVLPKDQQVRLFITGGILGLLVAIYGVFFTPLPTVMGFSESIKYFPLIVAPILYAILWRYLVKPLNDLLGLQDTHKKKR